MKNYFNKRAKTIEFKIDDNVLLWDSSHAKRGRHSKFQNLWLGPFKIAFILDTNSYLLKDMDEWLFSYSTNGSHSKHYVEPSWPLVLFLCKYDCCIYFGLMFFFLSLWFIGFILCCLFCIVIRNKVFLGKYKKEAADSEELF